jgi:hypothetical protein
LPIHREIGLAKKSKIHSKIKATSLISSDRIKPTPIDESILKFSFKYLDLGNPKFAISKCEQPYFKKVLERFRDISSWKESEIRHNNSRALRSHAIRWADTTEPKGFAHLENSQLRDLEGWQFEFSSNKHGRVHGFLLSSVFYVVWFDPNHNLYS